MTETSIAAGEFKAKCLKMMADVERTSQPLVITKRGKPLVKIIPYVADDAPESAFGCMEGSATLNESAQPAALPEEEIAHAEINAEDDALSFAPYVGQPSESKVGSASEPQGEMETLSLEPDTEDLTEQEETKPETPEAKEPEVLKSEEAVKETPAVTSPAEKDLQDAKKPLPISKAPLPTRGLPIDSPLHQQKAVPAATSYSTAADLEESDDELYIPSFDEDEALASEATSSSDDDDFNDIDDFLLDEEDDDIFDMEENSNDTDISEEDDFFFTADDEDLNEIDRQMQQAAEEDHRNNTASSSDNRDMKQMLERQFTSAWNRNPTQGDDA